MSDRKALTYRGKRGHALVDSKDVTTELEKVIGGLRLAESYLDAEDDMVGNAERRIRSERRRLESLLEGDEVGPSGGGR